MARRKQSDIGKTQFSAGFPGNQRFNVHPRPGKKRRSWWNGFSTIGGGTSN
jgi:hypothetical protein